MTDNRGTTHKVKYGNNQFKIDEFWFKGKTNVPYEVEIYYTKNGEPYRRTGTYIVKENPCAK